MTYKLFCKIFLLCIFFFLTKNTYTQVPDVFGQPGNRNTSSQRDTSIYETPDTSAVLYFYNDDLKHRRITDTLEAIQIYNPVYRQEYGYYQADIGSPHRQSVYQPLEREGIDLGFHHYDLYLKTARDIRFFNTNHPYSQFSYTAGTTQDEGYVNGLFAQNINNNISAAIDFSRIIHRGGYDSQRVRHTNLGLSAWYRSSNDRYYGFFTWAGNSIKQQNNGGIQSVAHLVDTLYIGRRSLIPVNIETAQSEYNHDELTYTQYFNIFRKRNSPPSVVGRDSSLVRSPQSTVDSDSLAIARDSLAVNRPPSSVGRDSVRRLSLGTGLSHRFRYKRELLKSFDTQPSPFANPDFYGIFRTNERGLRHFVRINKFENRFGAFLYLGKNDAFRFEPALTHAFVQINQEPHDSLLQELRVSGKLSTSIANVFDLNAYAHYELGANLGDYLLKGEAKLKLRSLGTLEGALLQHQYAPDLIQYRVFISQQLIWENDFKKTNETNFMVKYRLPKLNVGKKLTADISGGIQNHLLSNLIYYDTSAVPIQAENELKNIAQVFVNGNFRWGRLHAENKLVVQQTDMMYLRLPRFWSQHSLFYQGPLFKSDGIVRIGADLRYYSSFQTDNWWALTGQFHLQDDRFISQPITDVFVSVKVNRFRAFAKVGNVFQPFAFNTRLIAPNYPTRDIFFRFGLTWAFMD